ncbi:MAG TPA: type II toxin-antitoxin system Phd/YefM family antitoxin [Caulobacteraceae bacterium]|nr:type II toxin-antitoxin system Phd/YefM family antitoxin [Caulobacteraceae bacterium]
MAKSIGAAEFKAKCLKLIDEVGRDGQPLTITKRGRPVAVLAPAAVEAAPLFGALKGSVLRYDNPFEPAWDPDDWDMNR